MIHANIPNMLTFIQPFDAIDSFPALSHAQTDPNGLIAVGGDLRPERLLEAYRRGIFPWFSEGQPILWWSPDPRMVLYPGRFHASRSLRKAIRQTAYTFSFDTAFSQVIQQCSLPRSYSHDTWITDSMKEAYLQLHLQGHAHSLEIWSGKKLVGGLYGIAVGKVFYGESMFSRESNVSKMAFWVLSAFLQQQAFGLVDCQVYSDHLQSLGAVEIKRENFEKQTQRLISEACETSWPKEQITLTSFLLDPGRLATG